MAKKTKENMDIGQISEKVKDFEKFLKWILADVLL